MLGGGSTGSFVRRRFRLEVKVDCTRILGEAVQNDCRLAVVRDGFSPEELRYGAIISVWVRWFWVIGALIEINYPAGYQDRYYVLNTLYVLTPGLINGYVLLPDFGLAMWCPPRWFACAVGAGRVRHVVQRRHVGRV